MNNFLNKISTVPWTTISEIIEKKEKNKRTSVVKSGEKILHTIKNQIVKRKFPTCTEQWVIGEIRKQKKNWSEKTNKSEILEKQSRSSREGEEEMEGSSRATGLEREREEGNKKTEEKASGSERVEQNVERKYADDQWEWVSEQEEGVLDLEEKIGRVRISFPSTSSTPSGNRARPMSPPLTAAGKKLCAECGCADDIFYSKC